MSAPRVKVLRRTAVYQGRVVRMIREELLVQGRRMVRESVLHPGAAVIVPALDRSRLILVRQYRRSVNRMLLELPAGTLERGEPPARCARRELVEETGWKAARLRRIGRFYAAPGFTTEQLTIFLAQGLTRTAMRPDPDEMVRPVILRITDVLRRIRSGEICDGKTIIGVLFARRYLRRPGA